MKKNHWTEEMHYFHYFCLNVHKYTFAENTIAQHDEDRVLNIQDK